MIAQLLSIGFLPDSSGGLLNNVFNIFVRRTPPDDSPDADDAESDCYGNVDVKAAVYIV